MSHVPTSAVERDLPATVLGVATCGIWSACAWFSGGFGTGALAVEGTTLILLLMLGLTAGRAAFIAPAGWRTVSLISLAAFVVWTTTSIAWAHVRAEAWVGAQKTLVYAVGFMIFALFRVSPRSLERILASYVLGLALVGLAVCARALHSPASSFVEGRLQAPTGYVNATVVLWMLGFWPACHAMSRRQSTPLVRAGAAAAATLFAGLAVLGQSRAWVVVSVAIAFLFLLVSPTRSRLLPAYGAVGAALAVAVGPLLAVFGNAQSGVVTRSSVHAGLEALALAVLIAAGLTAAWTALDHRYLPSPRVKRVALALIAAAAGLAVVAAAVHYRDHLRHPYRTAESEWRSFTGDVMTGAPRNRFFGSLGGDRYGEWRIAWAAFRAEPLTGIGAENFEDVYLLHRSDSIHEPSYPHSVPLGLLSQLGIVGACLFVAFVGAALAALRCRLRGNSGGAAAAALMVSAYWLAHGTFDWLWEFPALAGPALGFLGLVAAPQARSPQEDSSFGVGLRGGRLTAAAVGAGALIAATAILALASTALADAFTTSAEKGWRRDPARSFRLLDLASRLYPLSGSALVVKGSIALDSREYRRARLALAEATGREPRNWYAWFQLALADASRNRWAAARTEILRARSLNPRDPVVLRAVTLIAAGKPFSAAGLDALYLGEFRLRFHIGPPAG